VKTLKVHSPLGGQKHLGSCPGSGGERWSCLFVRGWWPRFVRAVFQTRGVAFVQVQDTESVSGRRGGGQGVPQGGVRGGVGRSSNWTAGGGGAPNRGARESMASSSIGPLGGNDPNSDLRKALSAQKRWRQRSQRIKSALKGIRWKTKKRLQMAGGDLKEENSGNLATLGGISSTGIGEGPRSRNFHGRDAI